MKTLYDLKRDRTHGKPSYSARARPSAHARGMNNAHWNRLRAAKLAADPFCQNVFDNGDVCGQPAIDMDHIVPWRGDHAKKVDWDNLQSLCKQCHGRKTRKEGRR